MTSSPVTPGGQGWPSGVNASTAQPRRRPPISPARTSCSGDEPMNAVHTSVPPQIDETGTPTTSDTQRNPSAGSGDPVEPTQRNAPRSGVTPAFRQAIRNGAEAPNTVVPD